MIRKDLVEFPSEILKTGITREAVQDLKSQFGKEADNVIGALFRGISNEVENTALLTVLNAQAKDYGNLQLSESTNAEMNLFETTQRVHEIILKMNLKKNCKKK